MIMSPLLLQSGGELRPEDLPGLLYGLGLFVVCVVGWGLWQQWQDRRTTSDRQVLKERPSLREPQLMLDVPVRPSMRHADSVPVPVLAPAPAAVNLDIPYITLAELAAADNLLIVGNRGSGKTTLLSALLRHRRPAQYIFDPHSEPGKWETAKRVIGAGRAFQAIYAALLAAYGTMDTRSKELAVDGTAKERFIPFSVISDEWGSVNEEIVFDAKTQDAPGKLVRLLLKEGRKFKISFIASAHGDTNASLGCTGDKEGFVNSFDWFIYCGAFVAQKVPMLIEHIPLGRTPEGGTFPLIVVAYSPTTRQMRLLDLRDILDERSTMYRAARSPLDLEQLFNGETEGDDQAGARSWTPDQQRLVDYWQTRIVKSGRELGRVLRPDTDGGGDHSVKAIRLLCEALGVSEGDIKAVITANNTPNTSSNTIEATTA